MGDKQTDLTKGKSSTEDHRLKRQHKILVNREEQLHKNLLVAAGGQPYINEALSRMPSESDMSWLGDIQALQGAQALRNPKPGRTDIIPRRKRAHLINYAKRIINKINQFVFSQDIVREGVDEDFLLDATITGQSLDGFMESASSEFTHQGWCWLQVDKSGATVDSATGEGSVKSMADTAGDRIFYKLWEPLDVLDWSFSEDGMLKWLITQEVIYVNDDPTVKAFSQILYTIWTRGGGTRIWMKADSETEIEEEEDFTISAQIVPFVLLGVPSSDPHWFDEVERVQASILNLDSSNNENLTKAAFPQFVIPAGMIEQVERSTDRTYDEALEIVRGLDHPFIETPEDAGLTRIISPVASDLLAIPTEITRLRKELFEIVGLAMNNKETRQVMSAESKAWDNLDPQATLRARSISLEEAETKCVAIAVQLDTTFKTYNPIYPRQFDLVSIGDNLAAILDIEQGGGSETMIREIAKMKVSILDKIQKLPEDKKAQIMKEIDEIDIADLLAITAPAPEPFIDPDEEIDE